MVTSAHRTSRRRGLRFAILAAVLTLTACGLMTGPLGQEAPRLPLDRLPAAEPSEWPSAAPPLAARPTATAPPPTERAAASPRSTAAASAGGARKAEPVAPQPAPTLRAVEPPAPESPAAPLPSPDRRAQKLPVGDLPGWKQVFVEDFNKGNVPVGAFPSPAYSEKWSAGYKDGTPDTAGQRGAKSRYYPSKVLSVKNGMLDWYLHMENGISMGAAPTPKIPNNSSRAGGLLPRHNSLLYGRISVRFKADPLHGYKAAWLLWPDSGVWPRDGEVDYPEGDLSRSFYGVVHYRGNDPKATDVFRSQSTYVDWHVATLEWTPDKVEFFLDGKSLGAGTTATPITPMHYILQTESCLTGCPSAATAGHLYLDWIAIWKPA
jgi:hypothetical protein